jgi:hypothetical protein
MSKIVKVSNGDYSLQVKPGGNIIFDTTGTAVGRGSSTYGKVTIWGNLDVKGVTTVIESTTTTLTDPFFEINSGLGSNGITVAPYEAGFQIDRGIAAPAQIFYNENVKHYDSTIPGESGTSNPPTGTGTFVLRTGASDGVQVLNALQLRTITTDTAGDLAFDLQGGAYALSIVNSGSVYDGVGNTLLTSAVNYANLGLSAWHVPNVQYLNNYIASSYTGSNWGQALTNAVQYPLNPTLSGVTITGTSGQFFCSNATLFVGMQITVSGTLSGVSIGSITGYSNPTTYKISATNGYNTFTLQTLASAAIVTTAGKTTGLTFTNGTYGSVTVSGTTAANGQIQFNVNNPSIANPIGYFAAVTGTTSSGTTTSASGSLTVGSVRIYGDTINDISSNNLTLTSNSGTVEVNAYTKFDNQSALSYNAGTMGSSTQLYSRTNITINAIPGNTPGRTGLFIVNPIQQTPDELISRNRAVLLSILL